MTNLLPRLTAIALTAAVVTSCSETTPTATSADEQGRIAAGGPQFDNHEPPPILAEALTQRHEFTDKVAVQVRVKPAGRATEVINVGDASNMAVLRFTVQPGVRFPWHSHPGVVLVSVTEGELVFVYADDCIQRRYPVGTAFVDPGFGNIHYAFNPTAGETVVVATFLGVPPTGPLTLPASDAVSTALDAKCGVAPPTSHSH
jgi:hypothetical protein